MSALVDTQPEIGIESHIRRCRANLLLHSYIFFFMEKPVWTMEKYISVTNMLLALQAAFPEPINYYDHIFKDWDGDTSKPLPTDSWSRSAANKVWKEHHMRINQAINTNY